MVETEPLIKRICINDIDIW